MMLSRPDLDGRVPGSWLTCLYRHDGHPPVPTAALGQAPHGGQA